MLKMTHIPKGDKVVNTQNLIDMRAKKLIKDKKRELINKILESRGNYVNLNRLLSNEKPGYWINLVYIKSNIHKGKYPNTFEYYFEDIYLKKYQLLSSSRSILAISAILDLGDEVRISTDDEKQIEIDLRE